MGLLQKIFGPSDPRRIAKFSPKEDITAWESTYCLIAFVDCLGPNGSFDHDMFFNKWWPSWDEEFRRHWEVEAEL